MRESDLSMTLISTHRPPFPQPGHPTITSYGRTPPRADTLKRIDLQTAPYPHSKELMGAAW